MLAQNQNGNEAGSLWSTSAIKIQRPVSLVTRASAGDSRRKVWRPAPNAVGMVSLKFHDMDTRPDLDPWLGGLFVLPEWRNRGVGAMLMHRVMEEARRLNISVRKRS
jgi:GNAT superfamily N-acetyltransferase